MSEPFITTSRLKPSPIQRGTIKRAKKSKPKSGYRSIARRYRLNKVGKQGRKNQSALKIFKAFCLKAGIDRCELRFENCTGTENLTWAHGRKRRHLKEGELEAFAVIACTNCHWKAEKRGEAVMTPIIQKCIDERVERYTEAA